MLRSGKTVRVLGLLVVQRSGKARAQPGATILRFKNPLFWCGRPSGSGGRHVKGEHVKDAAQDGSVKVFILPIVICGGRVHGGPPRRPPGACMHGHWCATTTTHWTPLPHHHHHRRRRQRRRQHVKDAAQDAAENAAEDVAQDLAFGARAARALLATPPPPPPPSLCSSR